MPVHYLGGTLTPPSGGVMPVAALVLLPGRAGLAALADGMAAMFTADMFVDTN